VQALREGECGGGEAEDAQAVGRRQGQVPNKGQYSAATIRATRWLVQDACAETLTRVAEGVVSVRDTVKRKTFLLRAGKAYTARPRR
jgi:hypothetical protein